MENTTDFAISHLKIQYDFTIMIAEALTTKLARERLASIKKFIPVRDNVRNKLQRRQEMQTDFSIGSEHLLAPVTTATKDVKTATKRAIYGEKDPTKQTPLIDVFEKIVAETERKQQGIQELKTQLEIEQSGDISPEPQPEHDDGEIETIFTRGVSFID